MRRLLFSLLIQPTLGLGHVQAWIAVRRKRAAGTWTWNLWFLAWGVFFVPFSAGLSACETLHRDT